MKQNNIDTCTVCNQPLLLRKGMYCSKKCNSKAYNKKYYKKNKERELNRNKEWSSKNRESINKKQKIYRKTWLSKGDNLEKTKQRLIKYREENKEIVYQSKKRWQNNNKDIHNYNTAKRRAKKINATIEGFECEIREIYRQCSSGYHVDHIIPLNHKYVCGLHVPWNLQIITAEENLKKSNKLIL